jgi:hypothetical protein
LNFRLYPNGVGEVLGQFCSAFLRPVKNEVEMANPDWVRPISQFSICVKRANAEENPTELENENLVAMVSEPDFSEFNEGIQAWGFHEFHALPIPFNEMVNNQGNIVLEIDIFGTVVTNTSTIDLMTEIELSNLLNGESIVTPEFGPPNYRWSIQFLPINDNFVSAHVFPVFSDTENRLGSCERVISSFTLKVGGSSTEDPLAFKSLTGSFNFSNQKLMAGWDEYLDFSSLQYVTGNSLSLVARITWDPSVLYNYTAIGRLHSDLSAVLLQNESLMADLNQCQLECARLFTELESSNINVNSLSEKLAQKQGGSQHIEELKSRLKMLTAELDEARYEQKEAKIAHVKLATVKAKLASIVRNMTMNSVPVIEKLESTSEIQCYDLKNSLSLITHEKAQLELKLVQLKSELDFLNRSSKDKYILESNQDKFGPDLNEETGTKLENAISNANHEIEVGKAALEEIKRRDQRNLTISEIAGEIADLSMVQCGVDVAYATLLEVRGSDTSEDIAFTDTSNELKSIQSQLLQTRSALMASMLPAVSAELPKPETSSNVNPVVIPPPLTGASQISNRKKSSIEIQPRNEEELRLMNNKIESILTIIKSNTNQYQNNSNDFEDYENWEDGVDASKDKSDLKVSMVLI